MVVARLTNRLLCPHHRLTPRRKTPTPGFPAPPREISPVISARSARTLIPFVVLVLTAVGALSLASPAAAATPCGKKVLGDWFDNGRIDRLYPLNCYEEAIDAIPADLRDYADAEEVITRALQAALNGNLAPGGADPSPGDSESPEGSGGGPGGPNDPSNPDGSGTPQAAPGVDTSSPSSVPIPLLVLGGMSLALLAAGGLGYLSRRRQAANADDTDDDTLI
jgi:hypothetical protein